MCEVHNHVVNEVNYEFQLRLSSFQLGAETQSDEYGQGVLSYVN